MMNFAIQILTVLCALAVNFAIPALFGLTEYGLFLQGNILVFLFQKLTDIANEPLISRVENHAIFLVALSISMVVLGTFWVINQFYPLGSVLLLAAMLLSSCVLLAMYALRQTKRILVYLLAFLVVFSTSILLRLADIYPFDINDILILTNLLPAAIAAIALFPSSRGFLREEGVLRILAGVWASVPSMLSLTLVYNLFTNIFPFLLSKTLPAGELGLFRVIASLAQSATSFFPLNVKAIFVTFVRNDDRSRHYTTIMAFSLFYFAAGGLTCYAAATIWTKLSPYTALICTLPSLYWAVLSERYLQAIQRIRYVRLSNLAVGALAFGAMLGVKDIHQAILCYALGFSAYTIALLCGTRGKIKLLALVWVCGLPPMMTFFFGQSAILASAYLAGCIAVALGIIRFSIADLRALKGAL